MELKRRQESEINDFRQAIESGTIQKERIHYSTAILEMQKKAEYLGQTGFYKEAKLLRRKVKDAQCIEQEKYNVESRKKLFQTSNTILSRHKKELKNLQKKHQSQRESLL